jgi:hypothetical protein
MRDASNQPIETLPAVPANKKEDRPTTAFDAVLGRELSTEEQGFLVEMIESGEFQRVMQFVDKRYGSNEQVAKMQIRAAIEDFLMEKRIASKASAALGKAGGFVGGVARDPVGSLQSAGGMATKAANGLATGIKPGMDRLTNLVQPWKP